MTITKNDFAKVRHKVITLMGMSGVGKTYLSSLLANEGWFHYSCDLEIGTKILGNEIESVLGEKNEIKAQNLSQLSRYVGQMGKGGLPIEEFKRRQRAYGDAEQQALYRLKNIVSDAIRQGYTNIIHDSTGSFCEVGTDALLTNVDENSLIVYIKASPAEENEVLRRAREYPKPLFFSPERFDRWVEEYKNFRGHDSADNFDKDDFSKWVFPRLFENRLPKYQRIADTYGVTIPSDEFKNVKSAQDFLTLITRYLPDAY